MSRHRHKAKGGGVKPNLVAGNPDVIDEAEGGDEHVKEKRSARKRGGHVEMHGHKSKHRADRPGRKRGGGVGADKSPLSSAHSVSGSGRDKGTQDTYGGTP